MERRRLAGMKPASLFHHRKLKKFKKFLKNEKELQGQQLANPVSENLSEKTRSRVIVARNFFSEGLLFECDSEPFCCAGKDHLDGYRSHDQAGNADQRSFQMDSQQHPVDWQCGNHQCKINQQR